MEKLVFPKQQRQDTREAVRARLKNDSLLKGVDFKLKVIMIATAVLKGSNLSAYDKNGRLLWTYACGEAVLLGYTATTVSIKKNSSVIVLGENGRQISSHAVG